MFNIIIGRNRAEFDKVKDKDMENRCFFRTRNQTYKNYPDGVTRMDVYEDGIYVRSEEVFIYAENKIEPHNKHKISYDQDDIIAEIFNQKMSIKGNKWQKLKPYFTAASGVWKGIYPFLGLIIAGGIMLWAIISAGGLH